MSEDIGSINTDVSILHLLSHRIKSLTITGVDFHRSAYQDKYKCWTGEGYRTLKNTDEIKQAFRPGQRDNHHHPDKQYLHFKQFVYGVDERVVVDRHMKFYLSDDKYDIIYRSDDELT